MELRLDLSKHCIETELQRQYNRAISKYFGSGKEESRQIEETIEMVRCALETLKFPKLRSRYPELAGGTNRNVFLSLVNENVMITIDGKTIDY